MNMDKKEKESYLIQGDRIPQDPAHDGCIVPAAAASSSCNGLGVGLPTGPTLEVAPVVDKKDDATVQIESNELKTEAQELESGIAPMSQNSEARSLSAEEIIVVENSSIQCDESKNLEEQALDDTETASLMSFSEDTERVRRPTKRKRERNKPHIEDSNSSDSDAKRIIKTKLRNRRTIADIDDNKEVESTQDAMKSIEKLDIEIKRGAGRPKKKTKAVDPDEAEKEILKKIGKAPEYVDRDLLKAMTASDICAQALEHTSHIEEIRTKCGRLQGGLSGELKKRILSIEEYIRVLQVKAETTGDPELLKYKINQLLGEIRKYKLEEQTRKREIEELTEIIKSLKKENKSIREEMRKIREEISSEKERHSIGKKNDPPNKSDRILKKRGNANIYSASQNEDECPIDGQKWHDEEIIHTKYFTPSPKKKTEEFKTKVYTKKMEKDGIYTNEDGIYTNEEGIITNEMDVEEKHPGKVRVMRSPIGGVSTPIWIDSQSKEERQTIV